MFISDEQWAQLCPLLPDYTKSPKGGRPRLDNRKILEGIIYVFQNNVPWKAVPKVYGSGTALNDYFRAWAKNGVFHTLKDNQPPISPLTLCLDWDKIETLKNTCKQSTN